jgi:hypothetical protein
MSQIPFPIVEFLNNCTQSANYKQDHPIWHNPRLSELTFDESAIRFK